MVVENMLIDDLQVAVLSYFFDPVIPDAGCLLVMIPEFFFVWLGAAFVIIVRQFVIKNAFDNL
jgi:hypothetical protein